PPHLPSFPTRRSSDLPLAVAALIRALSDDEVDVRDEALRTLVLLDRIPSSAEKVLLVELGENNWGMRAEAVTALGKLDTITDDGDRKSTRLNSSHVEI